MLGFPSGVEGESHSVVSDLQPHEIYSSWNSPGKNTGVGSLSLLQRIFLTQGWNPDLPHCRQILYQMSRKESLLEWVVYPFSSRYSRPRNETRVSCVAGISGKETAWQRRRWKKTSVHSMNLEDPLEEGMAIHYVVESLG